MLGAAAADRQATAAEQGVMAEAEQEAKTLRQPQAEQTALAAAVVEHGLGLLALAALVRREVLAALQDQLGQTQFSAQLLLMVVVVVLALGHKMV